MKLSINLASRRYPNERALKIGLSSLVILLLLVLAVQGSVYLENHLLSQQYQSHLDSLREQLRGELPKQLTVKELEEQRQDYKWVVTLLQRDAFHWTKLFDRMERLLPEGVSLLSFKPDYDKSSLLINGVAKNLKNLQSLLDNLHSGRFEHVYLKNQGEVEVDNGHGGKRTALSFSISLKGIF